MHDLNNKNNLLEHLGQGATIITPNNRLSDSLLKYFYSNAHHKTADKPKCLPYSTCIVNTYHHVTTNNPDQLHPILINEAQCQHLWRKIIKSDPLITYSEGLLNAVMQAWEHCLQWQINLEENPSFHYTPQTRQFQLWCQTFVNELYARNLISEHQLIPYLIQAGCYNLFTQAIVWACFDDFSPQQLSLQRYLESKEIKQYRYDLISQSQRPEVLAAQDNTEELQQLISWLHLKIEQGEQRIGVVVPNLEQESRSLQRTLLKHFDPALFNISLGQNLSEFSLVAHALSWLNLDTNSLTPHQAALLLQSPYIANAKEEFIARSHFLQNSTLLQDQSFPLKTLINNLHKEAPKLAQVLEQLKTYPKTASPQDWILLFQERLNTMGFPGDYGLDSTNYQCFKRFTAAFDEFRQLSLISTTLSSGEAITEFTRLLNNTIFQAQKSNASIQISGLLEASGCEFDSLWVMGLTDQCLPQKTRLSAFIPPQLQRELNMPHSIPARELQFAQQILARLQNGSKATVFSYARLQGDNPHLPCSLIKDFPHFKLLPQDSDITSQSSLLAIEEAYSLPLLDLQNRFPVVPLCLLTKRNAPLRPLLSIELKLKLL